MITLKTFTAGEKAIFPVSSTLIMGEKDAILVNAQFQKQYAQQVIEMIKASGRQLKAAYISHSDPDFYFGAAEILKAFPQAEVISTAQTAYLIESTKEAKLAVWKEALKEDFPTEIIVPQAVKNNVIALENEQIEVHYNQGDEAHSFLHIPSLKTIVGGISISVGAHLWMADTQGIEGIDTWIATLELMQSLAPAQIIPSHFVSSDFSVESLNWVKEYLMSYRVVAEQANGEEIAKKMTALYPTLAGQENMIFGAKVFAKEAEWHVATPYPPIYRTLQVRFNGGDVAFDLDFLDNHTMRFKDVNGAFGGVEDTVHYQATEVAPNVFMVYWSEPNTTKANVVHIQDYNTQTVYTNIAAADGQFFNMKGTLNLV